MRFGTVSKIQSPSKEALLILGLEVINMVFKNSVMITNQIFFSVIFKHRAYMYNNEIISCHDLYKNALE